MNDQDEILQKYYNTQQDGKEPIRLLKNIDHIQSWSMIPSYQAMIITEMNILNDVIKSEFPNCNIIEEIIRHYCEINLSREGYARTQFKEAHSNLNDKGLTPILAGMLPEQQEKLTRK